MTVDPQEITPKGSSVYRMDRMERDIAEIKSSVMAIQASTAAWQLNMGEAFVSRREFSEWKAHSEGATERLVDSLIQRIADSEKRTTSNVSDVEKRAVERIAGGENRQWTLIIGIALALLAALFSLLRTIQPIIGGP